MTRNFILGITFVPYTTKVIVQKYDMQNENEFLRSFKYDVKNNHQNAKQLFDTIRSLVSLGQVKAISFIFVDALWFSNFEDAYAFRLKCFEFCKSNGIFYHFTTNTTVECLFALSSTKTMVKEGEQVVIFQILPGGASIGGTAAIRGNGCYDFYETLDLQHAIFTQEWKNEFLKKYNPKKLVLTTKANDSVSKKVCKKLETFFEYQNSVVDVQVYVLKMGKSIADLVLHEMEEKINPYHFANHCLNGFRVVLSPGDLNCANGIIYEEDLLIASLTEHHLPYEESAVVPVVPTKCIKLLTTFPVAYIEKVVMAKFKTKKVKVTLKIDTNCFYTFNVESIPDVTDISAEFSKMDITVKENLSKKARIVCDKIYFYIYVIDENGKEYMIKDSNGSPKIPLYLAFTETEPLIGQQAKDLYHQKPDYIVFDLIHLCSLDHAHVLTPFWKFNVEKENGSLMVTVKTGDGDRRSSVQSLLGLVLERILKVIENETSEEMEEFRIDFEGFVANEILKKNFIKAGKFSNVDVSFG